MKKSLIGLSALAALALVSCNKDRGPVDGPISGGKTNASLTVGFAGSMRGATDKDFAQADEVGSEAEGKLNAIYVLSSAANQKFTPNANLAVPASENDAVNLFWSVSPAGAGANEKSYRTSPWATAPGPQTLGVILNGGELATYADLTADTPDYEFTNTDADVALKAMIGDNKDNFVMTSKLASHSVKDGITKKQVFDAAKTAKEDAANNVFPYDVERVVCKGIVKKASNLSDNAGAQGTVDLASVSYAAVNGAVKTYLLNTNAGERTMADNKTYKGYKSALHADANVYATADAAKPVLVRLGNIGENAKEGSSSLYAPIKVSGDKADAKSTGLYFFENSINDLDAINNQGFYRMAYAKVYVSFAPAKLLMWDQESQKLIETPYVKGNDFYRGEKDGAFYASSEDAKKSPTAKDQKSYKYYKGRCAYRVLWNRTFENEKQDKTVCADTRRNNVYVLTINSFKGVGFSYDPSDPQDPNLPKPGEGDNPNNPDEPKTPNDDPRIDKQDTYMAVTATVLPWNVVSRGVDLE